MTGPILQLLLDGDSGFRPKQVRLWPIETVSVSDVDLKRAQNQAISVLSLSCKDARRDWLDFHSIGSRSTGFLVGMTGARGLQ